MGALDDQLYGLLGTTLPEGTDPKVQKALQSLAEKHQAAIIKAIAAGKAVAL